MPRPPHPAPFQIRVHFQLSSLKFGNKISKNFLGQIFWPPRWISLKDELLHLTTKWQDIEWWKLSFERLFVKIFCKNWDYELYLDSLLAIILQIHIHIQLNLYLKPCSYWSKSSFQAYRFLKIPVHRDMGRAKLQKMRSLVSLWFRSLSVLYHWS